MDILRYTDLYMPVASYTYFCDYGEKPSLFFKNRGFSYILYTSKYRSFGGADWIIVGSVDPFNNQGHGYMTYFLPS